MVSEGSNPYESPHEISEGSSHAQQPSLVVRGVRIGGIFGAVFSLMICSAFFVMHGGRVTALSILVFLAGTALGSVVGAGLAGVSNAETKFRNRNNG